MIFENTATKTWIQYGHQTSAIENQDQRFVDLRAVSGPPISGVPGVDDHNSQTEADSHQSSPRTSGINHEDTHETRDVSSVSDVFNAKFEIHK